ncbi:acyltransferase family protein [Aestuariimicrobium sp. Y1814]|uniref:acyltransferase family protein n=1 Tax=Aestuariimicrobium sp. Y1814 TaxID=3418742 RepID=UPI003DA76324
MSSSRFTELDGLRGIAAVLVLVTHYTLNFDVFFVDHQDLRFTFRYGGLGVNLFFMISGFVILMSTRRYSNAGDFAVARFVRLYPTYWACLALTIAFVFGFRVTLLYRPLWELAVNATMFQSFVGVRDFDGVYWSLARELVFYILIGLALALFRTVPEWLVTRGALVWSVGGLGLILLDRVVDSGLTQIIVAASVAQYAPLFGLGMLLYLKHAGGRLHPVFAVQAILAVVNEGLVTNWQSGLLVGLVVVLFTATILKRDVPVLRWGVLTWLGAISYPLYLLHQNIGYVVMERTVDYVGPWPSRVLALVVALLLAWAVHELVEKRLSRRLHRRIKDRRGAAEAAHEVQPTAPARGSG